ncbi:toxin-activating lysine-acyltransferase [Sphingopyxis indica]|uniref:toxin-activating lysine-acyltransferase n=1 Tax=Sphingopyxis indica TaxID=436663 RepID=UPI002938E071|nr:toxin-activating lysine-acyltransferase [Sphingopyxis indica]WOF43890.1 toxin-activating lysine-acyltransferase [Sphingopyxis indica]
MNRKPNSSGKKASGKAEATTPPPTVSHLLGEMTWLLTQSPLHRAFSIGDLEWLVMPALIHQQFYMFRDGQQPVGLAMWAKCTPEAVAKLDRGMIEPENRLTLEEWTSGDQVWLVDLVAPFANAENRHRELMIADLISKPLKGVEFHFHQTDPATGKRVVQTIAADAGDKLLDAIKGVAETSPPE